MHWLPLAKFAYDNSDDALTGITPFSAEKCFHPSIKATVLACAANGCIPDVPNVSAWAEKLVELLAVI